MRISFMFSFLISILFVTNVQAMHSDGATFREAIIRGDCSRVQGIIDRGCNINEQISFTKNYPIGCTPLHYAVLSGRENIVALLLSAGADVDAQPVLPLSFLCNGLIIPLFLNNQQ